MDVTTKGIALKATDYKENDKLILLYSLEYGKITVHAKGIRKGNAKLKFAADQFCFGRYELSKIDDRFTLKTCEQLESFFSLREDIFAYYAACTVAECLANFTEEGQSEPNVFVETLKALSTLTETEPLTVTLKYLLTFLQIQGTELQFDRCVACGEPINKAHLDLQKGGAVCDACSTSESISVSARTVAICNMVKSMPYAKLCNLDFTRESLKDALQLVYRYIAHSFSPLKSLSELLRL